MPPKRIERRSDVEAAGDLLDRALGLGHIAPHVPGEPDHLAASLAAREEARAFLADLARVAGVSRWDEREFERAVLNGALQEWRPGRVERVADGWRIESRECPLLAEAALDPRVCEMCQAFQLMVAHGATRGRVADVEFSSLVTRGDGKCSTHIRMNGTGEPRRPLDDSAA